MLVGNIMAFLKHDLLIVSLVKIFFGHLQLTEPHDSLMRLTGAPNLAFESHWQQSQISSYVYGPQRLASRLVEINPSLATCLYVANRHVVTKQ